MNKPMVVFGSTVIEFYDEGLLEHFIRIMPPFEMDDRQIAEQLTAQVLGLDQ